MKPTGILFPHQLFENNILISNCSTIFFQVGVLFFKPIFTKTSELSKIFWLAKMENQLAKNGLSMLKTGCVTPKTKLRLWSVSPE